MRRSTPKVSSSKPKTLGQYGQDELLKVERQLFEMRKLTRSVHGQLSASTSQQRLNWSNSASVSPKLISNKDVETATTCHPHASGDSFEKHTNSIHTVGQPERADRGRVSPQSFNRVKQVYPLLKRRGRNEEMVAEGSKFPPQSAGSSREPSLKIAPCREQDIQSESLSQEAGNIIQRIRRFSLFSDHPFDVNLISSELPKDSAEGTSKPHGAFSCSPQDPHATIVQYMESARKTWVPSFAAIEEYQYREDHPEPEPFLKSTTETGSHPLVSFCPTCGSLSLPSHAALSSSESIPPGSCVKCASPEDSASPSPTGTFHDAVLQWRLLGSNTTNRMEQKIQAMDSTTSNDVVGPSLCTTSTSDTDKMKCNELFLESLKELVLGPCWGFQLVQHYQEMRHPLFQNTIDEEGDVREAEDSVDFPDSPCSTPPCCEDNSHDEKAVIEDDASVLRRILGIEK